MGDSENSVNNVKLMIRVQHLIGRRALETIRSDKCADPSLFVGLDVSYSKKYGAVGVAAAVTSNGVLEDYAVAIGEPPLEYIPGLLAFREAPILYTAYTLLLEKHAPCSGCMVIVVDGHGIAHPRHAGIATHIGLALDESSIGVAKKKLYGLEISSADMGVSGCCRNITVRGLLVDRRDKSLRLAAIISPRGRKRRLYVSPGAYMTLETAITLIDRMYSIGSSLPAPTRFADSISRRIARCLDTGKCKPEDYRGDHVDLLRFLG